MKNEVNYQERINTPTLVFIHHKVLKIHCGYDYTYLITQQLEVWAWGCNQNHKLGLRSNDSIVREPQIINDLIDKRIDNIQTCKDHTFAWSQETGEVYTWGSNENGKLGIEVNSTIVHLPYLFEIFTEALQFGWRLKSIKCGYSHSLALVEVFVDQDTQDGEIFQSPRVLPLGEVAKGANKLFVWGNNSYWQLGLDVDGQEQQINVPHQLENEFVQDFTSIYANHHFTMGLNDQGQVYSWGSGEFGRLGFTTQTKQQKYPFLVKQLDNIHICSLALGTYHVLAISSNNQNGMVFSWGRGIHGQLGHGDYNDLARPKQIQNLTQIVDIACGESHSLILLQQGIVLAFGAGQYGQLGQGDYSRYNVPSKIYSPEQYIVTQIAAGGNHSIFLTQEGQICTFGCNKKGQLGLNVQSNTSGSQRVRSSNFSTPLMDKDDSVNRQQSSSSSNSPYNIHLNKNILNNENLKEFQSQSISKRKIYEEIAIQYLILENKRLKDRVHSLESIVKRLIRPQTINENYDDQ